MMIARSRTIFGKKIMENPSAHSMMPVIEMRMIPADAPQYWNFSLYPYFPKRGTPSPSRGCTGATGRSRRYPASDEELAQFPFPFPEKIM